MVPQDKPHACAEYKLGQREDHEVPERQAHTNGEFLHALARPSGRIMEHTPRTVWINFSRPGRSILLRSRCIKASSVFSSMSRSKPHTDSISERRETTLPARYISRSSRLYSVRVSEMRASPRNTSLLAGSRTKSETRRFGSCATSARRFTARSRATNSSNEKGLVM